MEQRNKKNILTIDVSDPQLLNRALSELANGQKELFACLNAFGPQILVRQFEYPGMNSRELHSALTLEALELLHINEEEVELDYQLLFKSKTCLKGIFIASPKTFVKECLTACDIRKITPVMLASRLLSVINAFLAENRMFGKNFGLIDFRKDNLIHLVVFDGDNCLLLREIHYENKEEAEREVINSLKYSCAKSTLKQLNRLYVSGDILDKEWWIERLEREFEVKPKFTEFAIGAGGCGGNTFFKLNLFKHYAVPFALRKKILLALNAAAFIMVLALAGRIIGLIDKNHQVRSLSASYSKAQVGQALGLLNQTKLLRDEK